MYGSRGDCLYFFSTRETGGKRCNLYEMTADGGLYFFVWVSSLGVVSAMMEQEIGPSLAPFFDISGFGVMLQQMHVY